MSRAATDKRRSSLGLIKFMKSLVTIIRLHIGNLTNYGISPSEEQFLKLCVYVIGLEDALEEMEKSL